MKELTNEINKAMKDDGEEVLELEKAAKLWTAHCVENYRGLALHKAIEIGVSILDFIDELKSHDDKA